MKMKKHLIFLTREKIGNGAVGKFLNMKRKLLQQNRVRKTWRYIVFRYLILTFRHSHGCVKIFCYTFWNCRKLVLLIYKVPT